MPETVGQRLRNARESQKLTLEKAASATRLRIHHLQALENDDYSIMASAAQGRGFLRLYAAYLGLNLDQMIKDASLPATREATPAAPEATPPSAPVAGEAVEPIIATPNADSSRPGFWSRLLRRGVAEPAPADEAATPSIEQPAFIVELIVSAQTVDAEGATARKPRATKARAPKTKKIVESNEADVQSASDKKKRNLNP